MLAALPMGCCSFNSFQTFLQMMAPSTLQACAESDINAPKNMDARLKTLKIQTSMTRKLSAV
jgi:hypothetical protein